MMYYLHFWTKNGHLDRVGYPSVEEAVTAAWKFENSERLRITGSLDLKYDGSFAGANRPKMVTVITDENNEDVETRIGDNHVEFFRLKHFLWHVTHDIYFMNEHHWADRFEAASRHLVPGEKYCGPDCYNCKYNVGMDGKPINSDIPAYPKGRPSDQPFAIEKPRNRDEQIMMHFSKGRTRTWIAKEMNLSYARVCQIIRAATVSS